MHGRLEDPGGLFLWAEDPDARPPKARPPGAPWHPGHAAAAVLGRRLRRAAGRGLRDHATSAVRSIELPSRDGIPLPSSASPGELAASDLAPFAIRGLLLAPADAFRLLEDPPEPLAGLLAWGDWVVVGFRLAGLASALARAGRVIPGLARHPSGRGYRARWCGLPSDAERADLARWGAAAPGCWWSDPGDASRDLSGDLDLLVDPAVRARLAGAPPAAEGPYRDLAGALREEESWLPDGDAVGALAEDLERARLEVVDPPRAAFRTALRLEEPAAEDDPWILRPVAVVRDEPSAFLVPADLRRKDRGTRALLRRLGTSPEEMLRVDAARLAAADPALAAWRDPWPEALELGGEDLLALLPALVARADALGITLEAPAGWDRRRRRPTLRLDALPAGPVELGVQRKDRLGREALAAFDWRVALGGAYLTEEELRRLAERKRRLVRVRGSWIELDPADLEALAAWVAGDRPPVPRDALEVLRMAAGLWPAPPPLAVDEAAPGDWLAALRDEPGDDLPDPPGLTTPLRAYQRAGVRWLEARETRGLGACLADDMGLGKTLQVLALLVRERARGPAGPTLVVAPLSVLATWEAEVARHAPGLVVAVHHGADREVAALGRDPPDLVLTSYDVLVRDRAALAEVPWRRLVLDEAQNVKNPRTARARAARALAAPRRLALTGTPVENRLGELHALMDLLNPGLLGRRKDFLRSLAGPIEREADGEALARLRALVDPFVLRRTKDDPALLPDLPPKLERTRACRLVPEQASLYQAVTDELMARLPTTTGMRRRGVVLAGITRLKQICNHPAHFLREDALDPGRSGKVQVLHALLEAIEARGEKALVFTQYRAFGDLLAPHLASATGRPVPFLHGGLARSRRTRLVARFQEDDRIRVLLVSLRAAGTGLDLSAARHVIHVDRWWNPAVEDQATDRAHRPGQAGRLQVHRLVTRGTLEERIDELLEEKRALADRVVPGPDDVVSELSDRELRDLVALAPRDGLA